jgi:hypothetical protein
MMHDTHVFTLSLTTVVTMDVIIVRLVAFAP